MILIVVKVPVRPAYADQWPTVVEEFTAAARAEPGNVCFDWYRAPSRSTARQRRRSSCAATIRDDRSPGSSPAGVPSPTRHESRRSP